MIKFQSYLANNLNNNKNNTAIIENYTSSMPNLSLYDFTHFIWKKVNKVVSCYILTRWGALSYQEVFTQHLNK